MAFVADCLDGQLGGGVISARRFVDQLRTDHEVVVIGTGAQGLQCIPMAPLRLPGRAYRDMGFIVAKPDREATARAVAEADVVHLQFPFWLSFVALEEAKRLNKPVVAAMHVQPENVLYNIGLRSPRLAHWIYDYYVEHYYNQVATVICPTAFAEKKLREHGLRTPVEIISNGFSPVLCGDRRTSLSGHFTIVAAGRYSQEKRQDILLEAVRTSRYEAQIQIVLPGAGPCESRLRRLGRRLTNAPRFGYLPDHEFADLLCSADLFVHCSEVELEGMAVLDAMSAGLPAIVANSEQSAASAFALDDRFSFAAGDVEALRDRIDDLIERPSELQRAGEQARRLAQRYEFKANAEKLSALYARLARRASLRSIG